MNNTQLPLTPPQTPILIPDDDEQWDTAPTIDLTISSPERPEVDSPIMRPRRLETEFRQVVMEEEDDQVVPNTPRDSGYEQLWNEIIDLTMFE